MKEKMLYFDLNSTKYFHLLTFEEKEIWRDEINISRHSFYISSLSNSDRHITFFLRAKMMPCCHVFLRERSTF